MSVASQLVTRSSHHVSHHTGLTHHKQAHNKAISHNYSHARQVAHINSTLCPREECSKMWLVSVYRSECPCMGTSLFILARTLGCCRWRLVHHDIAQPRKVNPNPMASCEVPLWSASQYSGGRLIKEAGAAVRTTAVAYHKHWCRHKWLSTGLGVGI